MLTTDSAVKTEGWTPLQLNGQPFGVVGINFPVHADERGAFSRLWCDETYQQATGGASPIHWCQSSVATTYQQHTLRGMHYQAAPHQETKLVSCVAGTIYDVVIDIRDDSPTRGQWLAVTLGEPLGEDAIPALNTVPHFRQLLVPKGFAHGYLTLTANTTVVYHMDTPYQAASAAGVRWNDPAFNIAWPADPSVINTKDTHWPDWSSPV